VPRFKGRPQIFQPLRTVSITSPAFIVIKAASELQDKTPAINQLWQTDFNYIKVLDWVWFYL
jgi:putative transposase